LDDPCGTGLYICYDGGGGGGGGGGGRGDLCGGGDCISYNPGPQPKQPSCTTLQRDAASLAKFLDTASSESMWLGFASGAGAVLSTAGEGFTFGGDTPVTITFGSMTTFFGVTSFATGAAAAVLNSYARGNTTALQNFNWSQLAGLAATAAASKLPFVKPWADRIGDLAGQATDLANSAKEPCQ